MSAGHRPAAAAATTIQRGWRRYVQMRLFRLLARAVRAAEHCITHEILRRVSPTEAELIKDPSMNCKVRFRSSFPCNSSVTSSFCSYQPTTVSMQSTRCSSQARQKTAKMKRAYLCEKQREAQKLDIKSRNDFAEHQEATVSQAEKPEDQSVADEEWEHEAAKLYTWSQALSLEDVG